MHKLFSSGLKATSVENQTKHSMCWVKSKHNSRMVRESWIKQIKWHEKVFNWFRKLFVGFLKIYWFSLLLWERKHNVYYDSLTYGEIHELFTWFISRTISGQKLPISYKQDAVAWFVDFFFKQTESELWCCHTDKEAALIVLSIKLIANIEEP